MRRALGVSLIILAVMLIRRMAWGRISRRLQYALWLSVPVYLVVSLLVSIPVAVPGIMRQVSAVPGFSENETGSENPSTGESEIRIASDGKRPSADHAPSSAGINASAESATGSSGAPDIRSGIRLIWAIGALSFLITIILNNLLFALSCRKNARYLGRDRETNMKICLLPGIRSPFLFGTRVYLPPDIIKNHAMRRHAVLHEYCHFRQGDSIWPAVRYAVLALNWFNPLVWIGCTLAARDSELSCDEAVISLLGEAHRQEYGETLIQMARRANGMMAKLTMSTQMGERGKSMKERIRSIAQGTSRSIPAVALSVALVLAITGCALTEPVSAASKESSAASGEASEAAASVSTEASTVAETQAHESEADTAEYYPGDAGGSVLFVNGRAYFADGSGIHAMDLAAGTQTDLVKEESWLSNINSGWMYYYKDTWTDEPKADSGIYRMNLDTQEEQKLLADDGTLSWNRWNIESFYGEDSYLYLNLINTDTNGLVSYQISEDGTATQTEDSPLQQLLNQTGADPVQNSLISGWIPTLLHYHKVARINGNPGDCSVEVLDADGAETITLDDVFGNIYPTCKGLAYQTKDYNVHLLPWDGSSGQDKVIFDYAKEGFIFNYGASDAVGIYGSDASEDSSAHFYRVSYDGTVLQLQDVSDLASNGLLVQAGLCGGNDWYGYYDYVKGEQVITSVK